MPTNVLHLVFLDILAGRVLRQEAAEGSSVTVIASGLQLPDGIVSLPDGSLLVGCMGATESEHDGYIVRLDPPTNPLSPSAQWTISTVIPKGVSRTPKQIALDPLRSKLYWSDREGGRVWRSNFDGSEVEKLYETVPDDSLHPIADQAKHCIGMAVDPEKEWVYWTQKGRTRGGQGKILRAPITSNEKPGERTDVEVLLEALSEPIDLDLIDGGKQLLWTDRGVGHLLVVKLAPTLNPSSRATIQQQPRLVSEGLDNPIGLTVDEPAGVVYYTDLGGSVYRSKLDGSDKVVLRSEP